MNFRPRDKNKPELNLIPMIDVLIVLLIFLVLTTTFSREAALHIQLPEVSAQPEEKDKNKDIELVIDSAGHYIVNGHQTVNNQIETLKKALQEAAGDNKDPLVVINADKAVQHQFVMSALDAAGQLGFVHVTFGAKTAE